MKVKQFEIYRIIVDMEGRMPFIWANEKFRLN